MPQVSEHTNIEGERITLDKIPDDKLVFAGEYVLSIWDDPPPRGKGIRAPMLLDQGTRAWLKKQLEIIECA